MTNKIKVQILAIRYSSRTIMFDTNTVQRITYESEYYELVCYIKEHLWEYVHFILPGEE